MKYRKRIVCNVITIAVIAFFFWGQSRIPALTEKAQMGQRTVVDAIAFDVIIPVKDSFPLYKRIAGTTVNWSYTNWKGMTFGLLFGASFLTLLRCFRRRSSKNALFNTVKGTLMGFSLGVCVNCSTPIAQSMHRAGIRLETVLATLVSSPTLNVIVLTMSFSLLPVEYALAKLAGVVVFVFVLIPLLVRFVAAPTDISRETEVDLTQKQIATNRLLGEPTQEPEGAVCELETADLSGQESWPEAVKISLVSFFQNLVYIFRAAVPLMLLAGFLGAAVVESIPLEGLQELAVSWWSLALVGIVGTFLPVPIAFDVILVSILLSTGMTAMFAMTLLFTLGIFSIYPFLIIWRNISPKIALNLFLGAVAIGLISGFSVHTYETQLSDKISAIYSENVAVDELAPDQGYRAQIGVAKRQCNKLDNPLTVNKCLKDFISTKFRQDPDPGLCRVLEDAGLSRYQSFCIGESSFATIVDETMRRNDLTLCGRLTSKQMMLECQNRVLHQWLSRGAHLKVCEQLEDPNTVEHCKKDGVVTRLKKFNDNSVCNERNTTKERNNCLMTFKIFKLSRGGKVGDCAGLPNEYARNFCMRVIATDLIDQGKNEGLCSQFAIPGFARQCRARVFEKTAIDRASLSLCQEIKNPKAVEICRRRVIAQLIQREIDQQALEAMNLVAGFQKTSDKFRRTPGTTDEIKTMPIKETPFLQDGNIQISFFEHRPRKSEGKKAFSRVDGTAVNINKGWEFSFLEFIAPFRMGRGIASGDYNNDHWPDLLLTSNEGVLLYTNTGDGRFAHTQINAQTLPMRDVQLAAFVDIDNDGWQDIFLAGYGGQNHILLNDRQRFKQPKVLQVPNDGANLSFAAGFADLDRNGYLDFVLGNWSFGDGKGFLPAYSANRVYFNFPGGLQPSGMKQLKGETLSVLFSDLDNDNIIDLAVANEFSEPDLYYLGTANDGLQRVHPKHELIPVTSMNTMSLDTADFNNDLRLDLFMVDFSFSGESEADYCDALQDSVEHKRCLLLLEGRDEIKKGNIQWCLNRKDSKDRNDCMTAVFRHVAIRHKDLDACGRIPESYHVHKLLCSNLARKDARKEEFSVFDHLHQEQGNRLLISTPDGRFEDATQLMGVGSSYWSWNAKAADLDNDEWQDIYVGNGYGFGEQEREVHSNVFYHNNKGQRFSVAQDQFGLSDFINTPSYTYLDMDLDGDLDIIAVGIMGPVRVFINNESQNNTITFQLRDEAGNRNGIGAKIYITYGEDDTKHQLRELKLSGGFLSFDNPVAHFGLGNHTQVSKVKIAWSTGQTTILKKPFNANRLYIIRRIGLNNT